MISLRDTLLATQIFLLEKVQNTELPDFLQIATPEMLQEWVSNSPDSDGAYERLVSIWENDSEPSARWIVAAVITGNSAYELSGNLLSSKWDTEKLENDLDYFQLLQESVLGEVRSSFAHATGLNVLTEGRFAAGSEDVDVSVDSDGLIESVGDYWVAASNYPEPNNGEQDQFYTLWNIVFEDGRDAVFEYVEGSYEELTLG